MVNFRRSFSARSLFLLLVSLCAMSGITWSQAYVPDAAIPVSTVPVKDSVQFFALNKDRTLLGASTTSSSTYSLLCPAPVGLTGTAGAAAPIVFNEGSRLLFETGIGTTGTNAIVGVGADFSGTNCKNTPALAFYGTSVSLLASDRRNQRVFALSSNGSGTQDVITNFSTSNAGSYFAPGTLTKESQASLDTGGTYSALVPDVDGTVGYPAITQLRTDTSTGNLWIYDPSFARAVKVLGPGGVPLPAVNAFIIHNPNTTGGGLLVLTNQDLLTNANLGAPPLVTTPFTLIDMGLLGDLIQSHPTSQSVTLPYLRTIKTSLSYYAIFGSAFNVADNKLYLLIGTGTSATNLLRQVIRYDLANPDAPAETVVADISSVPLYPGSLPQIALNAASGTMQILTSAPDTLYTVNIMGTGDTAVPVSGSTFADTSFDPVAISTNPRLGETYIASNSGQVDVITRPASAKPRGTINLNGPLSPATAGQSTSLQVEGIFPLPDTALNTTPITITATAQSTGKSFTFASPNTVDTLSRTRYISGTFPSNDIYTVVASFPGDATYAAFTAPSVTVAVGVPLYQTSVSVVASASSQTAGTATVTLTGTSYTPTGYVTILDATTKAPLGNFFIQTGRFVNPISINFTIPAGTTAIVATYAGDAANSASTSAISNIPFPVVKSDTTLTLSGPTANPLPNTPFNVTVSLGSANGKVPTGQVIVNATPTGSTASQVGSVATTQAFAAGGATVSISLPAGSYSLQAVYAGDANFNASSSGNVALTVSASTTPAVSLNPTSLTFSAAPGTTSAFQNVVLTNTGGGPLNIANIVASGTGFAQVNGCPTSLAAGANCTIRVSFAPTATGSVTGAVTITDNATGSPHKVALTGTSAIPVEFTATSTAFTSGQMVGTSSVARPTLRITNNTSNAVALNITSTNSVDFELGAGCVGGSLAPDSTCNLPVTFHPSSAGAKSVTYQLNGAPGSPLTVTFTGTGTTKCDADQDGDGLCDEWETKGFWSHIAGQPDQFVDLPAMGAKVDHKDVFLHIDYMQQSPSINGGHTHQPKAAAMQQIVDAFSNAPVMNLDGTTGINLHIDCGPACYSGTGSISGTQSKAVSLPESQAFDQTPFDKNTGAFDWTLFDTLSASFVSSGRAYAFHHVIFGHEQHPGYSSSGISRNGAKAAFYNGASDLIVTLGDVKDNPQGSVSQQSGTLMHELGHNLGLAHGGQDFVNYKPNYISVMNYAFQFFGIITDGHGGLLDYSENALPDLDETQLNEQLGVNAKVSSYPAVGPLPSIDRVGTSYFCTGENDSNASIHRISSLNGRINWDCLVDKTVSPNLITYLPSVRAQLTGDPIYYLLNSFKDWPNLKFLGGAISGNGLGNPAPTSTLVPDELTTDKASLMAPLDAVSVSGVSTLQTAPGSTMTLRYTVRNLGSNDDTYALSVSSLQGWVTPTVTPATLSLPARTSAEVTITYTVPASAAAGDSDHIVLQAKSTVTPRIVDTGDLFAFASTSPAPLSVSVSAVPFGLQATGASSVPATVVVINTGTAPVSFSSIAASAEFSASNTCTPVLAPGASCTVSVVFTPSAAGPRTGTLTIASSATAPITLPLTGTAFVQLVRPFVTLAATPTATSTGQTVTLTAKVAANGGSAVPTGVVTFMSGTNVLGQGTLDAQGNASFTSTSLGATTYNVYASYAGDAAYFPTVSDPAPLTVVTATPSTLTLSTSAAAVATGSPVTFAASVGGASTIATGVVTFLDGGKAIGTGTLDATGKATLTTSTLAAGPHTITASYPGDAFYAPSTSTALIETVGIFATTTTVATPASPVVVGNAVALSATVAASAGGTPTGSVTFLDGTTSLGSATLNASGVASLSVTTLGIGTHTITAQYAASGNFAASTSAAKQVVITGVPDFSITAAPASLSITRGSTGSATFTVTPVNGYSGTIKFSCGTLPQFASCSFSAPQLAFTAASSTAQSSTLTIDTTAHATAMLHQPEQPRSGINLASLLGLPALLGGLGLLGLRRKSGVRRLGLTAILLFFGLLGALAVTGCGSAGPSQTPAGSYTVTVTLTDGSTSHAVNLPVTIN